MRRHARISLSPQLPIDGCLVHSATSKDKAIGLQGVENGHSRHARIVPAAAARPRWSSAVITDDLLPALQPPLPALANWPLLGDQLGDN